MCFSSSLSARTVAVWCVLSAALLVFPALSLAKCPGVHQGSRYMGWDKPFSSNAWPYYEKDRGVIRLTNAAKNDQVYINGCHLGKAADLDRFRLDPGKYTISVKNGKTNVLNQQVSVKNNQAVSLKVGDRP